MIVPRLSRFGGVSLVLAVLASPALAQYGAATSEAQPNNYPPALPDRRGPAPRLIFERLGEVPLPGPLGEVPAWLEAGVVAVPLAEGTARVVPGEDASATVAPATTPPPPVEWVVAPDGRRRYRATADGIVEAQKRSSPRKRWKRDWKIVAPNSIFAPPLLIGPRLCYSGLDDRVTCVRASNGHRLWAVDLGDRISRPLSRWPEDDPATGTRPKRGDRAVEGDILLVVPDDGASVVALDAYDGRRVASYQLPANHRFLSPALVAPGNRIALARKGYAEDDTGLVVLRLSPLPPAGPAPPVPYNDASPAQTSSPGR
ncbi:MAG TPA: hypothetical protein VFB67_03750 [Candidatus Polarisedimenticolaceae bacterium]|nr:hypothetical protein [Candidatus Polarisedimenticolaceae bacterium]